MLIHSLNLHLNSQHGDLGARGVGSQSIFLQHVVHNQAAHPLYPAMGASASLQLGRGGRALQALISHGSQPSLLLAAFPSCFSHRQREANCNENGVPALQGQKGLLLSLQLN